MDEREFDELYASSYPRLTAQLYLHRSQVLTPRETGPPA
jgi:hypothetical protein